MKFNPIIQVYAIILSFLISLPVGAVQVWLGSSAEFSITRTDLSGNLLGSFISPTNSGVSAIATVVPIPAAVWLFGSGLIGLIGVARRKA